MQCCALKQRAVTVLSLYLQSASPYPRKTGMEARDLGRVRLHNKRHVAVIQSHGITHGMWPGFVIPKFGNGNYYGRSIDGQDISDYDEKMSALYNAIKDVEDASASYGKGLFLVCELLGN